MLRNVCIKQEEVDGFMNQQVVDALDGFVDRMYEYRYVQVIAFHKISCICKACQSLDYKYASDVVFIIELGRHLTPCSLKLAAGDWKDAIEKWNSVEEGSF